MQVVEEIIWSGWKTISNCFVVIKGKENWAAALPSLPSPE